MLQLHIMSHSTLWNFFRLYRPLATTWRMYDNSRRARPKLLASGGAGLKEKVLNRRLWQQVKRGIDYED